MSDPQPGASNAPKTDNNKPAGGQQQQRKPQRGKNPSVSATPTPATSAGGTAQGSTGQASANAKNVPKKPAAGRNTNTASTGTNNVERGDGASRTSATSQDNKKPQNQGGNNTNNRGGRGGGRGGANAGNGSARKPSQGHASRGSVAKDAPKGSAPAPNAGSRNSAGSPGTTSMPIAQTSTLPVNAPPFQPGASQYPPLNSGDAQRHRKANSLGNQGNPTFPAPSYSSALQHFSPNLGAMSEDAEIGDFEDGEIPPNQAFGGRQGSFTAPRFQALAAQQQQTQQQSDEPLTPGGRPQLAPGFTFGGKRKTNNLGGPLNEEDANFQFPQAQQQPGFQPEASGGNNHRRTGSEITGIMAEQIALQNQIEALQQQQQQLLQQQIASNQVMSSFNPQMGARNNPAHRRIQSTQVPMGMGGFPGGFGAPAPIGGFNMGPPGLGLDQSGVPRGHGRRHSVNVLNKNVQSTHGSQPSQQFFGGFSGADGFEDGFTPPQGAGGHSRNASRADSSWRINGGAGAIQVNNGVSADLAQAQAQLQSLQQFRAAAGGHHHKMPSFSFPNMLPNMMAANMMGIGGFNLLQQQHQQFQMQLQQQSQPQRKSLFAPYLPQASLPPLLAAGKLVVGILRVNKRNRSDAYISTEVLDADIYICGSKDRNRALEGDIVAVELLDVDEVWGTKKEKEEKKRKKEENAAYDPKGPQGRKNDKKKDDVEVEGQGLMLFDDEEVTDEIKPQFAGHVVAVVERMPGQLFSGTLGLLRPSSAATKEKQEAERREREGDKGEDDSKRAPVERPKIVWFKPTDKRVPLIAIPTEQAPPDFVNNSEAYADKLFVACIKRHPISSLHPFGTLVEELGPIGDVEVETSALLKDCNFPTEEFTDNVIKCLPPVPWTIPEHEFTVRRDMREDRVFTIDPETAKDVDDAFSVKANEDGTYDVGVHIADVSFFVKPNTALDRDARKRATSVYLVQRAVPMLPPTLSEQLCSLLPGEERLAFSCIFTLTEDARVIKKWFGKTIIKSSAKLAYSHAQSVIDGKPLGDVSIGDGHEASAIEKDIKVLQGLANHLKSRRIQSGTLKISSFRLSFELGEEGLPGDCSQYEQKEAQSLVEEFMVLTNMSAAQQIAVHLPEQALLRRHEEPTERRLAAFAERAKRLGYETDISSAGALQRSFEAIQDPSARRILEILSTKAMNRAKYFCAGMLDIAKYQHYALNAPLYTHFTSPIRRYADVLVHRQLEAVLSGPAAATEPKFTMDRDSVAKVAQQCNIKRDAAKLAQEQSAHLFLCLLISDLTQKYGPVIRPAKVVNVLEAAFDVLVPEFGIEKRVHVDQMPIDNHVYDEHSHTLQIYWSERDVITWLAENSDDEHLKKVKKTAEQHAVKMEVASRSVHDESALFDEDDGEDEIIVNRTRAEEKKETSVQRTRSQANVKPEFEGLRKTATGHRIQDIKELMTVPVIVTADLTKSPPVIKVYSVNPYAEAITAATKK